MEEEFILEKKVRFFLIVAAFVIIVPLVIIVYWKTSTLPSGWDLVLKENSIMSFHGKVDSIYFDSQNHSAETLILSDGNLFSIYSDWAGYVAVGDSLSKDAGKLQVVAFRNGKKVYVLDYKSLIESFKKYETK